MVLKRFWEVFEGSERVWNGFMKFEEDWHVLVRFYEDLKVQEASRGAPGESPETFSEHFNCFEQVLGGF